MRPVPHRCALLLGLVSLIFIQTPALSQSIEFRPDEISGGAEASRYAPRFTGGTPLAGSPTQPGPAIFVPGIGFLAYNFDDNIAETGFQMIPPDPCGAAGIDRVLSVVNVGIECRDKIGGLIFRDALRDFFFPAGTLNTLTFDPKVVYDHYEGRFVVAALERQDVSLGDPSNESRILLAVSNGSSPASTMPADWWFLSINSKLNIGGIDYWADYPGLEVDEEAIYLTLNMYPFGGGSSLTRLWIIDKGVVGGFYAGGASSWFVYDPIPPVPPGFVHQTMMPALVFGGGGAGPVVGTYLVGYGSLTYGGPGASELVQVIRVDNPLGAASFTGEFVDVGDLENVGGGYGFPPLTDAPQSGSPTRIEVNDSRALDAVWRNNSLWFTATIRPNTANDPVNVNQTTAHWFRLDTSAVPAPITLTDQGNIGGEDIAAGAYTFMPSLAVNGHGDVKFGFAASAASIFCGAYFAGREVADPPGTVQAATAVQAGLDTYVRTFGAGKNRWGDYTGAAVDPFDDMTFWIFNEYAEVRGSGIPPEDGRWGTAWKSCSVASTLDFGDAPDLPYPTLLANNGARHPIVPNVRMGATVDPEFDGQPDPSAAGDDISGTDDEDGVGFGGPFYVSGGTSMVVTVSVAGWLDAWFDYNHNGSWADPGDQVFSGAVHPGPNFIFVVVPPGSLTGLTFARFRYNTVGALPPVGAAPDGEVEDYLVFIEEDPAPLDYGDAGDYSNYPTKLAYDGARHVAAPGVRLGAQIDVETDGQESVAGALSDDSFGIDDEDGVIVTSPLIPGHTAMVNVYPSRTGWIDLWVDFDYPPNGWNDPGELVYSAPVNSNPYAIQFFVPLTTIPGQVVFSRVRYNLNGPLPITGWAPNGEVEDHMFVVSKIDYSDAPAPYPTLLADDGARHLMVAGMYLGSSVDEESNGQPHANALGDDNTLSDDEDGVTFTTPLDPTYVASVDVVASTNGKIDAWIDFNDDGVWSPAEKILNSVAAVAGVNSYNFAVPGTSGPAYTTFARFRFSNAGGLLPTGIVLEGEVEDYEVQILQDTVTEVKNPLPTEFAFYDPIPNPFNPRTTLSFALPVASRVVLEVYDVRGKLVATLLDENRGAGMHRVTWDGRDRTGQTVASGVYLCRIKAGSHTDTKRMVLLK